MVDLTPAEQARMLSQAGCCGEPDLVLEFWPNGQTISYIWGSRVDDLPDDEPEADRIQDLACEIHEAIIQWRAAHGRDRG